MNDNSIIDTDSANSNVEQSYFARIVADAMRKLRVNGIADNDASPLDLREQDADIANTIRTPKGSLSAKELATSNRLANSRADQKNTATNTTKNRQLSIEKKSMPLQVHEKSSNGMYTGKQEYRTEHRTIYKPETSTEIPSKITTGDTLHDAAMTAASIQSRNSVGNNLTPAVKATDRQTNTNNNVTDHHQKNTDSINTTHSSDAFAKSSSAHTIQRQSSHHSLTQQSPRTAQTPQKITARVPIKNELAASSGSSLKQSAGPKLHIGEVNIKVIDTVAEQRSNTAHPSQTMAAPTTVSISAESRTFLRTL